MNFFLEKKLYSGIKILLAKKMEIYENKYNLIIDKKQIGWPFTESTESKSTLKKGKTFTKTKRQRPEKAEKAEKVEKTKSYKKANTEPEPIPEIFMNFKKFNPKKIPKGKNPNIQVSHDCRILIINKKILVGTSLEKLFKKREALNSQNSLNSLNHQNPHKSSNIDKNFNPHFPYNKYLAGYKPKPIDHISALKNPKLNSLLHKLFNNNSKNSKQINMETYDKFSEQFNSLKLNSETNKKLEAEKVELIDLDDDKLQESKPETELPKSNISSLLNTALNGNFQSKYPLSLFFKEEPELDINLNYQFKVIQGRQSSIQINYDDYKTLDVPAYLNDKIIMFYLKFLQGELAVEDIKGKFIILDSYFYQKLSKNENDEMSTPLNNYNSVKKWTKQLNFFQNEYIIVPINFDDHWSLLIICHPGKIENCFKKAENNNNDEVNSDISDSPKYPLIIYLDSFYEDNARCRCVFKKYLYYEYAHKHLQIENEEKIMSIINDTHNYISEFVPNVPKQPNCYDCGIYLLAYAELFLYDPKYLLKAYKESNGNLPNWFTPPFTSCKRDAIQELISKMINKSDGEINEIVSKYRNSRDENLKSTYDVPMSTLAQFEFNFDMNKTESNNVQSESDISDSNSKFSGSSSIPSKITNMKDLI